MNELPAQVLLRLGPSPLELTRLGASRVFRGNDVLAKFGPEDRIAREAFLFGEASALMPIGVPVLVNSGPGVDPDAGSRGAGRAVRPRPLA